MITLPTGHRLMHMEGDVVYLKTDINQDPRLITGITLRPNKQVLYCLACSSSESWHYDIEIDVEKDLILTITSSNN